MYDSHVPGTGQNDPGQPASLRPVLGTWLHQLESVRGVVFDVQRYSLHDGPGVRTNVFLKGCPLRCGWCANPESQRPQPELALSEHNCITCGTFATPCPICWQKDAAGETSQAITLELAPRVDVCPTGAIHWMGAWRSAGDIMQEVRRDRPFYGAGGGLTLTGGEPTMQPAMCEALLQLAKADGIATAMETCGHTQWAVFARLLPYLDMVLFDVKHIDADMHRRYTGIDNTLILDNLRRLTAAGAPVCVRVPLIPSFNATPTALAAIAEFVRGLPGPILGIDLLPYHTLGKAKYAALGREYPWQDHARLQDDEIAELAAVIRSYHVPLTIGG
jgi:pyruvate formate lyase activating enzyme